MITITVLGQQLEFNLPMGWEYALVDDKQLGPQHKILRCWKTADPDVLCVDLDLHLDPTNTNRLQVTYTRKDGLVIFGGGKLLKRGVSANVTKLTVIVATGQIVAYAT